MVNVKDSEKLFEMCQAKTMLYVSSISGHNNLGYISSLFVPIAAFFEEFWDKENNIINFDLEDEILSGCVITHKGTIVNESAK